MKQLVTGCRELEYIEHKYEALADRVMELQEGGEESISSQDIDAIENLWKNSEMIQRAVMHKSLFYLLDSYEYFLNRIRNTFKPDYMPSIEDILRARTKSNGIEETKFEIESHPFIIYDVGGQRGERKKWIHIFDGVSIIGYVASLSEYDQVLEEDRNKNRMQESLSLFEGILSLVWFKETPVILFLNKNDIFQEKIKKSELGRIFPEYYGGFDAKEALNFITAKYEQCNAYQERSLYIHVTTAIDTACVRSKFETSVKKCILDSNLKTARSEPY